jgi:hypothetical protein
MEIRSGAVLTTSRQSRARRAGASWVLAMAIVERGASSELIPVIAVDKLANGLQLG